MATTTTLTSENRHSIATCRPAQSASRGSIGDRHSSECSFFLLCISLLSFICTMWEDELVKIAAATATTLCMGCVHCVSRPQMPVQRASRMRKLRHLWVLVRVRASSTQAEPPTCLGVSAGRSRIDDYASKSTRTDSGAGWLLHFHSWRIFSRSPSDTDQTRWCV